MVRPQAMGQSSFFVSARSGASGGLQLPTYGLRLGNQQGFANEQSNLDSRGISQGAVASYGVGVPAQSFLYGIRQPQKSTTGKEILGDHKIDINVVDGVFVGAILADEGSNDASGGGRSIFRRK
ncbi:hypothetical protein Plhal304r1_c006g0024701 [Plasmopara halstedii]